MNAYENKILIELALAWRALTCSDAGCGDHDCMARRSNANELISMLNILNVSRPDCAVVGCMHIGPHAHSIEGPVQSAVRVPEGQ